jgi:long-chain acyl-CoA synthetase
MISHKQQSLTINQTNIDLQQHSQFVHMVHKHQVTHTITVPTQIFQFLALPAISNSLSSLQVLVSVGAPLPLTTKQELQSKLPNRLNEIYGLTEGFSS